MPPKSSKKLASKKAEKFITVRSKSYGSSLQGQKIYYVGKRPAKLKDDGSISFGKHILELLARTFDRYRWIITPDIDSIDLEYGIHRVRTSIKTLNRLYAASLNRTRDIKNEILKNEFSRIYPDDFTFQTSAVYQPGTLSRILKKDIVTNLSPEDKDALNKFLPDFIATEATASVNLLKAKTQIKSLKELVQTIREAMGESKSENWWQEFIRNNILLIQQGYIQSIEKMNISVGNTKYPDFSLITHDNFLDILEIKKPSTVLIKLDSSRENYYWDTEISKAIIQVENYIETVSKNSDSVRSYILDNYQITLKVVRPRGIVLAGDTSTFSRQKEKDDFRLLTQSSKNITFVTYDELVNRLENYIKVLEKYSKK